MGMRRHGLLLTDGEPCFYSLDAEICWCRNLAGKANTTNAPSCTKRKVVVVCIPRSRTRARNGILVLSDSHEARGARRHGGRRIENLNIINPYLDSSVRAVLYVPFIAMPQPITSWPSHRADPGLT